IDDVIAKAMAKGPGHRYPRAGDLASELRAAMGPAAADTSPSPVAESILPTLVPIRRRRTAMIGAAIAAVAAIAIVVVIALSGGGSKTPNTARHRPAGSVLVPNVQGVALLDPQTGKVVRHAGIELGTGWAL